MLEKIKFLLNVEDLAGNILNVLRARVPQLLGLINMKA